MLYTERDGDIFLRLDPGEEIIDALKLCSRRHNIQAASINSGVGMADGIEFGFYCIPKGGYEKTRVMGIRDISSIEGNITWLDNSPYPHVHMTINDANHRTMSGHVMSATCHITMELVLHRLDALEITRKTVEGKPASTVETRS